MGADKTLFDRVARLCGDEHLGSIAQTILYACEAYSSLSYNAGRAHADCDQALRVFMTGRLEAVAMSTSFKDSDPNYILYFKVNRPHQMIFHRHLSYSSGPEILETELRREVKRLRRLGVKIVLTNSVL